MLLEEFKNCLPERIVIYLNEQKLVTLQQAAQLADEFTLTHKTVFAKRDHPHVSTKTDVFPQKGNASVSPCTPPQLQWL